MINSNKILHLCVDDSFTDIALQYFEKASPENNIVIKFGGKEFKKFKGECFYINKKNELVNIINKIDYQLIIVHALNSIWFDVIQNRQSNIKVVWIGWGYDYYDLFAINTLLEKTNKYMNSLAVNPSLMKFIYTKTLKPLISNYRIMQKQKVISQIDYFAPVLQEEYSLFEKAFHDKKRPSYIGFNYGVLEKDLVKGFENRIVSGNDILLGNSSSATCNHIEAIDFLKSLDLQERKVICPLSYGDQKYQTKICSIGAASLKNNFIPLLNLLPIEEYITTVVSCGNVIMNHVRQQAMGNIILMLYLGAKIFLRKENLVYTFLKNNGFIIFLIEDILLNPKILDKNLTTSEIESNRIKLQSFWGEEVIMRKTKNITSLVAG